MPKVDVDYSNTLFYKIYCKDTSISEVYIGHTTNFVQRKSCHKQSCNNSKCANHDCKLYKFIRDNGGWDNWRMDIVAHHECNDHYEARKKEQEYFILYKATLNSIEPMPRPKCVNNLTLPMNKINIRSKQLCENCKYECKNCNYTTIRQSQYTRHLMTALHNRRHMEPDECNTVTEFVCSCGNKYKYKRGLSKHKQKCYEKLHDNTFRPNIEQYDDPNIQIKVLTETIIDLVKQTQEFKDIMIEQTKHMMELAKPTIIPLVNKLCDVL